MFTDRPKASTWFWTQLWYSTKHVKVWNYFEDHAPPGQTSGAYHESEINYVFNNLYATNKPLKAKEYEIAKRMNNY